MSVNPYFIEGPALVSFSGGRTSGYMLRQILDAHGGALPPDVHVCFANTGQEREETLRFVFQCQVEWGVPIHWLEYLTRRKSVPAAERFREVTFMEAAREGEPFKRLVTDRSYTPNALARFCTEGMKVDVLRHFMESRGYVAWTNVIGLRADEMRRAAKQDIKNEAGKMPWQTVMPMVKAGAYKADVLGWWKAQPFDLQLADGDGNCDLCFLKSKARLLHTIRRNPARARNWIMMEKLGNGRFVTEYSYADLVRQVAENPLLPLDLDDADEFDAECGVGGTDNTIRCGKKAA